MASYAIMRVQKLKTNTAVRGSLKHAFRDIETPNADSAKLGENSHVGATSQDEAMEAYKELLPEKVRKNGVRCLEYLMTASPEKMHDMTKEEQDDYFKDCRTWLEDMHGKEQVFYSGVHRDETTPHMYAYVVPLSQERDQEGNLVKPGKLNAREFIGGKSTRMSELQTEFAEVVGQKHGMERGQKGSKAKHQRVKRHYGKVDEAQIYENKLIEKKEWTKEEKGLLGRTKKVEYIESEEQRASRIAKLAVDHRNANRDLRYEKESLERRVGRQETELKELQEFRDLSYMDRANLKKEAEKLKEQSQEQQKQEEREKVKRAEQKKEQERQERLRRDQERRAKREREGGYER